MDIKNLFFYTELLHIILSIIIIIFSINILFDISDLRDLKIKTSLDTNNINIQILNNEENIIKNNNTNIYSDFFNKYDLKEGLTLNDNITIKQCFDDLQIINKIFFWLLFIPFLIPCVILIYCPKICDGFIGPDPVDAGPTEKLLAELLVVFLIIARPIIILFLLYLYIKYLKNYNNEFGNDFVQFYENINNKFEKESFKKYYKDLFDLKGHMLKNRIAITLDILNFLAYFLICLFYK